MRPRPMDPIDAAAEVCRRYPGGVAAMAQRLGKAPTTLRHELNPPDGSSAKLGLSDFLAIVEYGRDTSPLDAIELLFGRTAVPLPDHDEAFAGEETVRRCMALSREFTDVMHEASEASRDGKVTDNELQKLQRQALELMSALQALLVHFAQLNGKQQLRRVA